MQKLFTMTLLICADEEQTMELQRSIKNRTPLASWVNSLKSAEIERYDSIFILNNIPDFDFWDRVKSKIIFINEPIFTRSELKLPPNVIRINGWPGFLGRAVWEGAGVANEGARRAAALLGKELVFVKDIPGLISARVIAAIISEAIKTLEDGVATKEDIDLALKLGTNYPFGPFEWNEKIGAEKIQKLSSLFYNTEK